MIIVPGIVGKKYAILGLGKSGIATAACLAASQADFVVWDDGADQRDNVAKSGYRVVDLAQYDLTGTEALILSPGIPHTYPAPHPVVARFKAAHIPIIGDMDLLFQACPNATYIGITGTNGKSTTTALIGHILKNAGYDVEIGGNLGTPVLSFTPLGKNGIYVLELSSYQLDLMRGNSLDVGVLLNITSDHLARHGGMDGYIAAKAKIFTTAQKQQTLVIGQGETETRALAEQARKQQNLTVATIESSGLDKLIDPASLPALPGLHNWQNASAAYMACHALRVSTEDIMAGLNSFPGLTHRQQLVATVDGIRFINDSKATNADAASKALGCYNDIYWIIGGQAKEGGLNGLEPFIPRIRHAYIIGEASELFAKWCEGRIAHTLCGTLNVATHKSAADAHKDNIKDAVVLLSPACASWDQFRSFEHRGDSFTTMAQLIAKNWAKP